MTEYCVFIAGTSLRNRDMAEWEMLDKVEAETPRKARMKVADSIDIRPYAVNSRPGDTVRLVSVARDNVTAAGYEVQEGGGLYLHFDYDPATPSRPDAYQSVKLRVSDTIREKIHDLVEKGVIRRK